MLRTLIPNEPELLRLCRTKNWLAVTARAHTHPFEATPSDLALHGEGPTALSLAIRCGAPVCALQSLVKACIEQVAVRGRRSILMEALRHQVADDAVEFLLQAVLHYQSSMPNRINDVLGSRDDLGQTVLHYFVERLKGAWEMGESNTRNLSILRSLLQAMPESVQALDSDGNTPLVLLLLLPQRPNQGAFSAVEEEISQVVQLMLSACPWAAAVSRRLPEPWHSVKHQTGTHHSLAPGGVSMDGSPTPLYYAILHGRSLGTINAILNASRQVGIAACTTIISSYHEVPLHTAICTQTSMPILARLVQECPGSVLCADVNGLTPLDWMWIRHVADWHTNNTPQTLVSRGRYIPGRFLEWHQDVSREISRPDADMKGVTRDLMARMDLLLPAAAAIASPEVVCKSWSLLHVTCYVPCPLAMVHLALQHSGASVLQSRDRHQRLPLHWAAARFGYAANFPVGFSRSAKRLVESTPVPALASQYEPACCVRDGHGQLPLHIAIDAARHYREVAKDPLASSRLMECEVDAMEEEVLTALLSTYPESLECLDGKSGLLPFQQAAIGAGTRLNTIYVLFRLLPALVGDTRMSDC